MEVKQIMPSSRTFHWHTAGICMVPAAVVAASLLIGGVANSAPPGSAEQAVTEAAAPTTTSTTLTPSATRVAQGTAVTLTATVNPANAVGTVQFKDGATVIATPALSNGIAVATPTLAAGSHSLTATFIPVSGSTAFSTSTTESPVTVVVGPTDTTTRLTTTQEGDLVRLNAVVTPANAAGTVQFRDGNTPLGEPQPVINGVATGTTSRLGTGTHALVAEFIPTNMGDFAPSRSDTSSMTMTRSGAGSVVALDGLLSLDLGTSLLDDHACVCDGRRGNLDDRQVILDDRRTLVDGRVSVLDDRPLLNVVLGLG
jgi:Bacterial Ig-like domain (group 3)